MADCLYLRKSRVDMEAESSGAGDTLSRHEQALLRHASTLGRTITHIYREVVSGETISARPQMQKLLRDVEAGAWDAVHVMEVERLARGDTLDQGIVSQAFLYSGTLIITPKKTYDPKNEFDEEYFEFGLFMSRREYKTINRRQQAGRLASVREGKWLSSKTPYGFQRTKLQDQKGWKLEPEEPEASVVRDIFRWATEGYEDKDGVKKRLGVSMIVRHLNELGIPTPTGIDWTPFTVRTILRNEAYAGWVCWGRRANQKKLYNGDVVTSRPRKLPGEYQIFQGLHTPIVDQDVFDKVQTILVKHPSLPGPKKSGVRNPLAGLVVCSGCGRAMIRRPYQSGQEMLICPYTSCKTVASDLRIVEASILSGISDWLQSFELSLTSMDHEKDHELETMKKSIDVQKKELVSLRAQEKRAFELVEQNVYSVDQFLMRSKELADRKLQIENKVNHVSNEIIRRETAERSKANLIPQIKHVLATYPESETAEEKNKLLRSIIAKVVYTKTTGGRYKKSDMSIALFPLDPLT